MTPAELAKVMDETWPAASVQSVGPWLIRKGLGGGQRVSAASAQGDVTGDDLALAETAMRALGQSPLFLIRETDGVLDAAVTIVLEKKRVTNLQSTDWIARQSGKIERGLKAMSQDLGENAWCTGHSFNLADIVVGCALFYLDFRFSEVNWRKDYPNLGQLTDKLAKRNSFKNTVPPAS